MTKLSVHITQPGNTTGAKAFYKKCADAGRPVPVVYALNANIKPDLLEVSPSTKLIYRRQSDTFNRLPNGFFTGDPVQSAMNWMLLTRDPADKNRTLIQNWALNPADFYDPLNEGNPNSPEQAIWLNQWMMTALDIAHQNGFKLALFSFATGCPDYSLWKYLFPAMRIAKTHGGILSLHEYSINGSLEINSEPGNVLRYRSVWPLIPTDCRLPIVITELSSGNGYDTGLSGQAWVNDMAWYDSEAMQDDYLLGACGFQLGGNESNMVSALGKYGDYIASSPINPPTPPLESPDNTLVPPTDKIIDNNGHVWKLGAPAVHGSVILRDDNQFAGGQGVLLLYYSKNVYAKNDMQEWYYATDTAWVKTTDPRPSKIRLVSPVLGIPLKMTNPFNAPCNYANGLHEGVDFRSYDFINGIAAKVSPACEGTVEFIRTAGYSSAGYGKYVVIKHAVGSNVYKTWYCHLASVNVAVGQSVKPGDVIGIAGATGTTAIHLHFNLQWIGNGLHGYYVDDVVDPLPYFLEEVPPIPVETLLKSGVGVGNMYLFTSQELDAMSMAKVQTILLLTMPDYSEMRQAVQSARTKFGGKIDIVGRLFFPEDGTPYTPQQAIAYCHNGLQGMYDEGIREFQVGNEPNIYPGGMGWMWNNGVTFAAWLDTTLSLLRAQYPNCKWGYPALSPQPNTESFFRDSKVVAEKCEWVGVHSYWWTWSGGAYNAIDETGGMSWKVVARQTSKPLYLTEYSCNTPYTSYAEKGTAYKNYIALLKQDGRIVKAHSFCLSWDQDTNKEAWVIGMARNQITDIPRNLGA